MEPKKNSPWIWVIIVAVIVLGYFYLDTPGTEPETEEAETEMVQEEGEVMEVESSDSDAMVATPSTDGFALAAESLGNGEVRFEWSVSEDLVSLTYIIVRGDEVDPMHDGTNFWFRQHDPRRTATWIEQPVGTWHYRICQTVDKAGNECGAYSNDVEITVE